MKANPILLQKKYSRIIALFAEQNNMSLNKALDIFYKSQLYEIISKEISDMHCMSDQYLVDELKDEWEEKTPLNNKIEIISR